MVSVQNHDYCAYAQYITAQYIYIDLLVSILIMPLLGMATKRYPHHLPVRPNKGRLFLRNSTRTQKHKHI